MPGHNRSHYGAAHDRASREHRARWYADPATTCARCGRTIADVLVLGWTPRQAAWDAGHVHDGQPGGPYQPEHARCNRSAGQAISAARKRLAAVQTTQAW